MTLPSPANDFHPAHATLLLRSYHQLTGRHLIDPTLDLPSAAQALFEAPCFVASHNPAEDPVLTYGNQTALDLFEMSWDEFTRTPSRYTAEAPNRDERAHLLEQVTARGFIDDYSGIRISRSGRRFLIHQATVWNLLDDAGRKIGQAATFPTWEDLP